MAIEAWLAKGDGGDASPQLSPRSSNVPVTGRLFPVGYQQSWPCQRDDCPPKETPAAVETPTETGPSPCLIAGRSWPLIGGGCDCRIGLVGAVRMSTSDANRPYRCRWGRREGRRRLVTTDEGPFDKTDVAGTQCSTSCAGQQAGLMEVSTHRRFDGRGSETADNPKQPPSVR